MAWTSHGYQIEGTEVESSTRPNQRTRCGGPGLCGKCSAEQARAYQKIRELSNRDVEEHWHRKPARVVAIFWDGTIDGSIPVINWLRAHIHAESRLQPGEELILIGVPGDTAMYMAAETFLVDHGDKLQVLTKDDFHFEFEPDE